MTCCAGTPKPVAHTPAEAPKAPVPAQTEPNAREETETLGGDASIEIAAPSYAVMDALARREAAWRVLPHVAIIEDLGEQEGDLVWRVEHAFSFVRGGYVLRIRLDWGADGRHLIRFWVDKRFDRDVDDAWGYFLFEPLGPDRTRLRYHVRAVLLPGIIRWLFSEKVQWALMSVPERAARYVEELRALP